MSTVRLFPHGQWVQLGIADRRTHALIGDVGICVAADGEKAEIGFTMDSTAQGMGLGSEAVRAAISLIFERARPLSRLSRLQMGKTCLNPVTGTRRHA